MEAGSQDGETHSNTLHFEVDPDNCHLTELGFQLNHNWTGLLVEPHPVSFAEQRLRYRRASAVQSCLAPGPGPATLQVSTICTTLMIRPQFDPVNAMRGGPVDSMAGLVPGEGSQHTFTIQVSQLQAGLGERSTNCVTVPAALLPAAGPGKPHRPLLQSGYRGRRVARPAGELL